jgi:Tfp pilus assembly protein PilF
MRRFTRVPWLALLLLCGVPLSAFGAAADWQRLDVNRDGRFDQEDSRLILKDGMWRPSIDVNGDGAKDSRDAWHLVVLLSTWDRNADLKVDASDFAPVAPVSLPVANAEAASAIVAKLLRETEPKMAPGLQLGMAKVWPPAETTTPARQAASYEQVGGIALLEQNLDTAQWGFAKAATADSTRDSALANLAFTLAQTNRIAEALSLLAQALKLQPNSAVTHNNLAWIFARHGQLAEARRHYADAIRLAPSMGQYHLNLGIVALREGDRAGAQQYFVTASRLSPNDGEALRMAIAVQPATPADLRQYERAYEEDQKKQVAEGNEPGATWKELDTEDRMNAVESLTYDPVMNDLQKALQGLAKEFKERVARAVDPCRLQGRHWKEDLDRWRGNKDSCLAAVVGLAKQAQEEARQTAMGFQKNGYAHLLGLDRLFLEMALPEAQNDMAGWSGAQARKAFEATIDRLYTERMRRYQEQMAKARGDGHSISLEPELNASITLCLLGFMPIVSMGFPPEYYAGWNKSEKIDAVQFDMHGLDEPIFSLSPFPGLGLEWDTKTNEVKLSTGVIIVVSGTWSPTSGFGVQAGVGLEGGAGPLKVDGAAYIKRGSDGSLSLDGELNGGLEGGPIGVKWGATATAPIRAASHEPVGGF